MRIIYFIYFFGIKHESSPKEFQIIFVFKNMDFIFLDIDWICTVCNNK